MKKFAFVQNQRLPNEFSFGIYTVKSCQAAQKSGYKTYLIHPNKKQYSKFLQKSIWNFYKIKPNYFIELKINVPELDKLPRIIEFVIKHLRFQIQTWIFIFKTISIIKKEKINIIQTTSRELIFTLRFYNKFKPIVIYDVHVEPRITYEKIFDKLILSRINLILTNTNFYKNYYIKKGIKKEKIIILPSGFDSSLFQPKNKLEFRKKLFIPQSKFIIGFTGRFSTFKDEKGIIEMLKAVKNLKNKIPISALLVGGPENLIIKFKSISQEFKLNKEEAIIRSQVNPDKVPGYIACFDIACMLYPNSHHYKDRMSPQKAVEYMAMKIPIITTNLPSIHELIKEEYAYFINPINQQEFENSITKIYKKTNEAKRKAQKAYDYVQQFTWEKRQEKLFKVIELNEK